MKKSMMAFFLIVLSGLLLLLGLGRLFLKPGSPQNGGENIWIYPKTDNANPLWGIKNGIVFGIDTSDMDHKPAGAWAKGLLRIGWADKEGKSHFFNYIGVGVQFLGNVCLIRDAKYLR